ncbi:MAG TPA: DMT family transporter [Jatrophihabitans sp.]|jgi:drug/metabolite transporter (DMT)-like permease
MTVVLGLLAAGLYGLGDFSGGYASRFHNSVTVLLYAYPVGAVLMALMMPLFPGTLDWHVVTFGVFGGLAGLLGVSVMYQLMVVAPMNVISPVTAVLAAIVPVFVGVVIGERPAVAAWLGIALGLLAVVLVSRTTEDHPHGRISPRILALAGLAGLGFGFYFVFLARAGHDSGLWPLLVSRLASAVVIVPLAAARKSIVRVRGRTLVWALVAGGCDALANMFFLLSARSGLLSLASVLTSLYPAVTVLLAVVLLHEHTSRVQRAGLALAAASVVLITI